MFILFSVTILPVFGQVEKVYHWHPEKDVLIMISSGILWGGSEYLKSIADKATVEEVMNLNSSSLWSLDRNVIGNQSPSSEKISGFFLFGSIALPVIHFAGKKGREHSGVILAMTLEAFLINDGLTSFLKATTKRYRPYTYDPLIPIEDKLGTGARYSFASGHTSNVAVLSFLSAKMFSDLYPESKLKPLVWATAAALPALTGYMRIQAGRHFPTDVMAGYIIGASVGYLIPHMHKLSTHDHAFRFNAGPVGVQLTYTRNLK